MKVKLCTECEGTGEVRKRVDAYNSEWLECDKCNGSGRIAILRFREELPYKEDTSTIIEYRGKIESLLGELKEKLQ